MMKSLLFVVGARPNFMKIAPIIESVKKYPNEFSYQLIHTGQHYDENMSRVFFDELGMPKPSIDLEVGSSSHAQQTAEIMQRIEPILIRCEPDYVIVPGDVNSTLAAALVASKLGIQVAHVEAGLRSFDRTMPEEINRLITDQISDLLLTPSLDANENLLNEGVAEDKIHFVGNVMIDTLVRLFPMAKSRWPNLRAKYELQNYILVTLHRPFNVDDNDVLYEILAALAEISKDIQVVFPVHPRTLHRMESMRFAGVKSNLLLLDPLGYLDFLALQSNAKLVLTDSGGVQEETTFLGIPCLTARPNTERPITLTQGTNQLVASDRNSIRVAVKSALEHFDREPVIRPSLEKWDGVAATRIINGLR